MWEMEGRSNVDIYKAISAVSEESEIRLLDAENDYLTVDEKEAIDRWLRLKFPKDYCLTR